jgi:diguanylate cyclase (GGDEF)-like protein
MFYAILLHFMISVANRSQNYPSILQYFIYIPALITVYVFGFNGSLASKIYNLQKYSFGWSNFPTGHFWDTFFNIYYITYMVIGLIMLILWSRQLRRRNERNPANIVIISFIAAFALGTITDVIAYNVGVVIPQTGALIVLIPASTIFFAMRKYGFLQDQVKLKMNITKLEDEEIRKNIYSLIALYLVAGSALDFAIRYFLQGHRFMPVFFFNLVVILISLALRLIAETNLDYKVQDSLVASIVATTLLFIIIRYSDSTAISLWPVFLVVIMVMIVLKEAKLILALGGVAILAQIWLGYNSREVLVSVGFSDYLSRIGMIAFATIVAMYVNRLYQGKIDLNERHIKNQELILKISNNFLTVNKENFPEKVAETLRMCGRNYNVDRSYLMLMNDETNTLRYIHEWTREGVSSCKEKHFKIDYDKVPYIVNTIKAKEVVIIESLEDTNALFSLEKEFLLEQNISSILCVPVIAETKAVALLGFETISKKNSINYLHHTLLTTVANIMSDGYTRVKAEERIEAIAYYDSLTGLANRRLLNIELEKALDNNKSDEFVGVLFLDLDSFKSVNDSIGHDGGDEVLKIVSQTISDNIDKKDILARFGGDEYILVLPSYESKEAILEKAEKIKLTLEKNVRYSDQDFYLSASLGVAIYPEDGDTAQELITNADIAMYIAKESGKNQWKSFAKEMRTSLDFQSKLSNDIYKAYKNEEFYLLYQPQINCESKDIIGVEALIRWDHPEFGVVMPGEFIQLAERNGLISEIGNWIINKVCKQIKSWRDINGVDIKVAVNISAMQLNNHGFADSVKEIIKENQISSSSLEFEITEGIAIKENINIAFQLQRLSKMGVSIVIDDFGTEYSSLNRMRLLPIDKIKIDMSFIHGIAKNERDEAIIKTIIYLVNNLNMKVVAEGVETSQQSDFLRENNCQEMRGFLYSKAVSAKEIEMMINGK